MGDAKAFVLAIVGMLTGLGLLLGWVNYKIDKLKADDKLSIETIGSIIALEKAMKKLNEALKIHEHRLDHQRDDIYGVQRRLDILEANYPDSDIDYATLDDHDEVVEVWFNGKKYVSEDKLDEDSMTVYADGRIVAETTKPKECPYIAYKNMGGNGKTEQLLKRAERLDYLYSTGLISAATYRNMMEEMMQNDS